MSEGFALLAIGDELLDGRYQEAHTRRLAQRLRARGRRLDEVRIVADRGEVIVAALTSLAAAGHRAIVVTGGLGATGDDLTREAVAGWLGAQLIEDPAQLERVRAVLEARGRGALFDDAMRVHAHIPAGSVALDNPVGLATGFVAQHGTTRVAVLPGVPRELEAMLDDALAHLAPADPLSTRWLQRRVLCFGITERGVEARLAALPAPAGFTHGLVPLGGPVELSISGHGDDAALEAHVEAVLGALEDVVASPDGRSLPERVGQRLLERGESVSTAESCTGGLVASLLTDVAGSSAYFLEGAVTYSNEAKMARLGVPPEVLAAHGAVSQATVEAMARGMRERAGTDWALALSGIAGPGGGTPDKPVGTVHTAIAGPDGRVQHRQLALFGLERAEIKERSALSVLFDLVRALTPRPPLPDGASRPHPPTPSP